MNNQPQNDINQPQNVPQVYGVESDQLAEYDNKGKTIQAIVLEKYCRPDDFVRVMNILDEVFYWQVLPLENEQIEITGDQFAQYKNVKRQPPKMFSLMPKATGVFRGYIAAKMINNLIKKIRMQEALKKKSTMEGVKTISADWYDYKNNIELIEKIFLGIENPTFDNPNNQTVYIGENNTPTPDNTPTTTYKTVDDLAKELGITDDSIKTEN